MRPCWQLLQCHSAVNRPEATGCSGTGVALAVGMREGLDKLEDRSKQFAIDCIPLCAELEQRRGLRTTAFQLADASGSVAANHRAMRRARSDREFRGQAANRLRGNRRVGHVARSGRCHVQAAQTADRAVAFGGPGTACDLLKISFNVPKPQELAPCDMSEWMMEVSNESSPAA